VAPAAKLGDKVVGSDNHIVLVPTPGGPVPTPTVLPFSGTLTSGCSPNVLIEGKPAAILGSLAMNMPPHVAPNGTFQVPPTNLGMVLEGIATVLVNGAPIAVNGGRVQTCNDPAPAPTSQIIAISKVIIGG
jgi:uncharacterized Zn-binding protein involved in type VI secretion